MIAFAMPVTGPAASFAGLVPPEPEQEGDGMIDLRQYQRQLRFSGAAHIQQLADKQKGPTCGFEAIENLIQLFHTAGNDLAETVLIPKALQNGYVRHEKDGLHLPLHGYRPILAGFGMDAYWFPPDFYNVIIPALNCNLSIVVVGNAYFLAPYTYGMIRPHAFLISNYCVNPTRHFVEGLVGLDSNFAGQECQWSIQSIQQALYWMVQNIMPTPVLVTAQPIRWTNKAPYYRRNG
jgi:hypothetical protein